MIAISIDCGIKNLGVSILKLSKNKIIIEKIILVDLVEIHIFKDEKNKMI